MRQSGGAYPQCSGAPCACCFALARILRKYSKIESHKFNELLIGQTCLHQDLPQFRVSDGLVSLIKVTPTLHFCKMTLNHLH